MLLKRLLFASAMSAGLVLGGCTTVEGWFGGTTATAAQQDAEKALTAAHALHDGFALTASGAAKSGTCTGDCATKAKSYLDGSYVLLKDADGLSDPVNIMSDVTAAVALLTDAQNLIH